MTYLILKKKLKPIAHQKGKFLKTSVTLKAEKVSYIELYSCIPLFASNVMLWKE
jgi:hypothetical protein